MLQYAFSPLFEKQINDFTYGQLFVGLSWQCKDPRNVSIFVPQDKFIAVIKPIPKKHIQEKLSTKKQYDKAK